MRFWGFRNLSVALLLGAAGLSAEDILIAGFESPEYPAGWVITGNAFGLGPASGTLPNQQPVSGMVGNGYVNSYVGGDGPVGSLQLPPVTLSKPYLNFLIGGGNHPTLTYVELLVDGKPVRKATGYDNEMLYWITWDVRDLAGKTAVIRMVDNATGGWGHLLADEFMQSDAARAFKEPLRPQFHFSPATNWMNDPNGMVYYGGEYHLFYQHNPHGINWGNMTWGHAVSPDMVHWTHLPPAITRDSEGCTAYSGTAVVDWNNDAGFQTGPEKTLLAFWTSFGCGQRLAYSNDKGRTWTKWSGNPIIPQEGEARDPKVFWHAPTKKWVLAVWTDERGNGISFYTSTNLKQWTWQSIATGFFECPDIFELAVDGNPGRKKWVLHAADGKYRIGTFNGTHFVPETPMLNLDWGRNWYASQSFSDIPALDGRRINISWMRDAKFPGMPFNGQMTLPTVFNLKSLPEGVRLVKVPIKELERLRLRKESFADRTVGVGQVLPAGTGAELMEIRAELEGAGATEFGLRVRGTAVAYKVAEKTLSALGAGAPLAPVAGRIKILVYVDRASLEVFGNDGAVSLSSNFHPDAKGMEVYAVGGAVKVISLEVYPLRGAWDPRDIADAWKPTPTALAPAVPRQRAAFAGGLIRRGAFDALGRLKADPAAAR